MRFHPASSVAIGACLFLLASCTQEEERQVDVEESPVEPPAAANAQGFADFDTTLTIRDVMNTLIDPHADALWGSVSYIVTAEGVEERFPQTEEDWSALRANAISMIEGANSLMIPGRAVAPPGATTEFPSYEYQPEEVAAKLAEDWNSWVAFAQGFQQVTLQALNAIERRDIAGLSEVGAAIDQACEACHSQYWYRDL